MASIQLDPKADIDAALDSAGMLGVIKRLDLVASLDTWAVHDRENHRCVVDCGIRLYAKCGHNWLSSCGLCVGMVHLLDNGKLLVSKLDIGVPDLFHPKTGIFAHQMEPVDSPYLFEMRVKELIKNYETAVIEWGRATERVKHDWDTCPDQNIPTMKEE